MQNKNLFFKLLLALMFVPSVMFAQKKQQVYEAANKFSTMWWLGSINQNADLKFAIQTSDYGMLFNYRTLTFESLWINENQIKESDFFHQKNDDIIPSGQEAKFELGFADKKGTKTVLKSSDNLADCQLIASGRYFQKRFINKLVGEDNADQFLSGIDIASFPDFFNIIYKLAPIETIDKTTIYMEFELPAAYSNVTKSKEGYIVCSDSKGKGFIIMPSEKTGSLELKGNTIAMKTTTEKAFVQHKEYEVGCVVYPFNNIQEGCVKINESLNNTLKVKATQKEPLKTGLNVAFDKNEGVYEVTMRTDRVEEIPDRVKDRMEFVELEITNDSSEDQVARLNFSKSGHSFPIIGVSGVLCDEKGMPTGIPVQISKNWHKKQGQYDRYQGSWIHMYTNITVPANTTLKLQYKQLAAYWGTLPAVSHAQLALPGWGSSHQLWDQSALGSWGENICYSPDGNVGSSTVTDVRASFTVNRRGQAFNWGGNVGGGDFIYLTDDDDVRIDHENIRIKRTRYAPNLSEVVYSGDVKDGAITFDYTTMLVRTDDMVKGYFTIRMDVKKDVDFKELVVFQTAAYKYHLSISNQITFGDKNGMIKSWQAKNEAPLWEYAAPKFTASPESSWIAFSNCELVNENHMLPANRGLIIREWEARLEGKDNVPPHWGEFVTGRKEWRNARAQSIMNLTVPQDCHSLKAGDYVETTLELVIYQKYAKEYVGPNKKFAEVLAGEEDSWNMTQREALENEITATMSKGKVTRNYPLVIEAENNVIEGEIVGGVAYIPLTITGLTKYENPVFYVKHDDKWEVVDQSMRGNDFWQCEYNAETEDWEITYNIPMDRDDYKKPCGIKFEFK